VPVPQGYREQLEILEEVLGERGAPYFSPELEAECPEMARQLWGGDRSLEEYAREIFPLEEFANGLRWMDDDSETPAVDIDLHVEGQGAAANNTVSF